MSTSTHAIASALLGDMPTEEAADLAEIDMLVQRQVFCPMTKKILDSRTAVLVRMHFTHDGELKTPRAIVVHPDADRDAITARLVDGTTEAGFDGSTVDVDFVEAAELRKKLI